MYMLLVNKQFIHYRIACLVGSVFLSRALLPSVWSRPVYDTNPKFCGILAEVKMAHWRSTSARQIGLVKRPIRRGIKRPSSALRDLSSVIRCP